MRELQIVSLLKDDEVRGLVQERLKDWMFGNDSCKKILSVLYKTKTYSRIIFETGLTAYICQAEVATIMDRFDALKVPFNGDTQKNAVDLLKQFIKERSLAMELDKITPDNIPEETFEKISEIASFDISVNKAFDFSKELDMKAAESIANPFGDGKTLKSSFPLINECLTRGGYSPGTLSMFVARSGCGKTTAMLGEAVCAAKQGFQVMHVFLGDMHAHDAFTKYVSHYTKIPIYELENTPGLLRQKAQEPDMLKILSRLRVLSYGSYELGISELVAIAKTQYRERPYHMLIIDYDGNIAPNVGAQLYESGGTIYSRLEWLSRELQTSVLVGCQAKPAYWDEEILPLGSAADSSKKQHAVDMMVTIGKGNRSADVGTMNIAKMRRGVDNKYQRIIVEGATATVRSISEDEYQDNLANIGKDQNAVIKAAASAWDR